MKTMISESGCLFGSTNCFNLGLSCVLVGVLMNAMVINILIPVDNTVVFTFLRVSKESHQLLSIIF